MNPVMDVEMENATTFGKATALGEFAITVAAHEVESGAHPRPLFLTPNSLSRKSAFGAQTAWLLARQSEYLHAYWDERDIRTFDSRSIRLESYLFARQFSFEDYFPARLLRTLQRCGLSWWDGNRLKAKKKRWLHEHLAGKTSVVYTAPSNKAECERTREILKTLNKPFVLHLWDLLSEGQSESSAFRWLVTNAAHVLCVSQAMLRHLAPTRPDARVLCFSREPSLSKAAPPISGPLRIMLIGYCPPYASGLKMLNHALHLLNREWQEVELSYVGSPKATRQWSRCFDQDVKATGFASSNADRDTLLSQGHIGFLPGPLGSPEVDPRSRFSIPSRLQDFLAVELPLIATVHKESATAGYLREIGLESSIFDDPARLAEGLRRLAEPTVWTAASERSHSAFAASCRAQINLSELLRETAAATTLARTHRGDL